MLKVLKYDWRNGWNSVRSTLIGAVILSVIIGALVGLSGGKPVIDESNFLIVGPDSGNIFIVGLSIVWSAVMIALLVITISTFFRNMISRMFGREGYLTHSLPVDIWELLLGKSLGTWIFGVFMLFVAFLCMMLMMMSALIGTGYVGEAVTAVIQLLPKLGSYHFQQLFTGFGYVVYGVAAFLAWSFLVVVQFQFICIAARQFGRFHVAGGFIVFWLLSAIENKLNYVFSMGFIVFLLCSAACFAGSWILLKKRLSF